MSDVDGGGRSLRVESVTIRNAPDLQTELAARLDEGGPVRIDGGGSERVDTAILQLLAAFVRDARADGRQVEWIACSASLRRAANLLGLESALGMAENTL